MKKIPRKHVPLLATAGVLIALFGGASLRFDGFCSTFVIADLFSENAFLGITAIGMTLVILSGGIDLSVGSVIGFTTIFTATMISDQGLPPPVVWAMALAIGTGLGAVMGSKNLKAITARGARGVGVADRKRYRRSSRSFPTVCWT